MTALGLKEGSDIDIVVTNKLFDKCIKEGWEQIPWTYPEKTEQVFLRKGIVELYLDVNCGNFNPTTTKKLIQNTTLINGFPFANLNDILSLKKEYLKSNPKHFKDIEIIKSYLTPSH